MLCVIWFHFGFKREADVALRWQCGFFGFKGYGTQGLRTHNSTFRIRLMFVPTPLFIAMRGRTKNIKCNYYLAKLVRKYT